MTRVIYVTCVNALLATTVIHSDTGALHYSKIHNFAPLSSIWNGTLKKKYQTNRTGEERKELGG